MVANVSLSGLSRDLARHANDHRPIRIGLVGAGEMGTDIVTAVTHMHGLDIGAIVDIDPQRGLDASAVAHGDNAADHAEVASNANAVGDIIGKGRIAVTDDASFVATSDAIDVIIDATGVPAVGAHIGMQAMEHGKHLVMMNVEADVTIGPYLKHCAAQQGVVYTLGAGDEPSSCMELIEFVSAMGYPIVCAGKGKNNPLNIDAVPADYQEEAARRHMNARMLVEFVDGSKTMVEMAALANATGLIPDRPGMHGPAATLDQLAHTLIPEAAGGVLENTGCVDYSIGKGVAPGVFVIADMSHARVTERMKDLKVTGNAPYFVFHRPYHLTSLEVPLTCARAVLYGKADMQPLGAPIAEVCAVAKRDLKAGDALDAIGETTYRCWTMKAEDAASSKAIPAGLLDGGRVTADIARGELLSYHNAIPADTALTALRADQDAWLAGQST